VASYGTVQQVVQQCFGGRVTGSDSISVTAFAVGYGILQDGEAMSKNLTPAASIYISSPPPSPEACPGRHIATVTLTSDIRCSFVSVLLAIQPMTILYSTLGPPFDCHCLWTIDYRIEQDRQSTYTRNNEVRSRSHCCWKATSGYIFWVCICNFSYPACNSHVTYCSAICRLSGCSMFLHVVSSTERFSEKCCWI
jgi:hypothetical protein